MKEIIKTKDAPAAIGPYSQAVRAGGFLFISGQIPLNRDGEMVSGGIGKQTEVIMGNISAILKEAGGSLDDIVKTTVYLRDIGRFGEFNEVYKGFFQSAPPARATVEVSNLPKGVDIEIDAVAYIP